MGRFFQYQITIQPGHQVVTSGPYRHLRHPAYTAIALILAGDVTSGGRCPGAIACGLCQ